MFKEKFEIRMVPDKVVVERKLCCDKCGKEIKPGLYFAVTTGHHDWGNDSCESIEHHDYCSHSCLVEALNDFYFKKHKNSSTAYFEIEREYFVAIKDGNKVYKE